jgi:HEAT repeat protein
MSDKPTNEGEIIAELELPDLRPARRRALLTALGRVGTDRSVDILRAYLRSSDDRDQLGAVFALEDIGTPRAVEALIECLEMEPGLRFTVAARSLGNRYAEQAEPAFIKALEDRRLSLDATAKRFVIAGLFKTPHRRQIPVLAALLEDRSRRVRRMAAQALERIRAPEARTALEEAATSQRWPRNANAKRALGLYDRRNPH